MTSEIVKKITQPRTYLGVAEISVEEKKSLIAFLCERGFTASTFYLRFFQKGFSEWEIIGIKECKNQFLLLPEVAKLLLEYVDLTEKGACEGDKGYLYTLAKSDEPGVFYQCLKRVNGGLCNKFYDFMGEKGMSSGTVIKRFQADDWKAWENDGISEVLTQFNNNNK